MERLFETSAGDPSRERDAVGSPLHAGAGAPLAARMRPRTLDEYVGQTHVLGEGTQLRTLLERDDLTSMVLWGPPGSGKTSLAAVIAATTDAAWAQLSAVNAGVKDVRKAIDEARTRLDTAGRRTVLFIDEIHRFNKSQQDALLPAVENGWVVLVGATTENPYFELNAPLLSRCRLVRLEPLGDEHVDAIVGRALADDERGLGASIQLTPDARAHLVAAADGDARVALGALESVADAAASTAADEIDAADVQAALAASHLRYDKAGDAHYDEISAFIKSMRGSDPDAAVYWLLRMLEAGEDPRFLARRMIIFASEDVGLADRAALPTAVAAFEALDRVGLPEARYNLVHGAIALATAPKSNAVARALWAGSEAVAEAGNAPVPTHLRDAHYRGAARLGHGEGYVYPHDSPKPSNTMTAESEESEGLGDYAGGHVPQQYLPDALVGRRLYDPTEHGDERDIARRVSRWRDHGAHVGAARQSDENGGDET